MEGYRVISSKKVLLCDINDELEGNVNISLQPKVGEIPSSPVTFDVVKLSCSPLSNKVIGIPRSPLPDEDELLSEVKNILSYDNDASNSYQQNSLSNYSFGSSTAQLEGYSSLQHYTLRTSNELYIDQNGHIQIEALENSSKYSPTESNGAINLSNSNESADIPFSSETDDASENQQAISFCRGKVKSKDSIEQYISYICPQCGVDCGPIDDWKLHTDTVHDFGLLETANFQSIVNEHGKLGHKCRDCIKKYDLTIGFTALLLHRITHMPFKDYLACLICSSRYQYKQSLKRHLQREHKELNVGTKPKLKDSAIEHIRFFCSVCKEEKSNRLDFETHMEEKHDYFNQVISKFEHLSNDVYICCICKDKVHRFRAYSFVEHIQLHEEFKSFVCTDCNYSYNVLSRALGHVRKKHFYTKKIVRHCLLCEATFKSSYLRLQHYKNKHRIFDQTCKACKKTFGSFSFLLSHMISAGHHTPL